MTGPRSPRQQAPQTDAPVAPAADTHANDEPSRAADDDLTAFITQARWLYELHSKRVDSANQRAISILGFVGVLLALIPSIIRLSATTPVLTLAEKWTVGLTIAALLISGGFALRTFGVRSVYVPDTMHLRQLLHDAQIDPSLLAIQGSIVETMLHGGDLTTRSPIDDIDSEATERTRSFKPAALALGVAAVGLAALTFQLFVHV